MRLRAEIAGIATLVAAGPVLLFPDLVAEPWRTPIVTALALAASALALRLLAPFRGLRRPLWIFAGALTASWAATAGHDVIGLRHFSGTAAGLLVMAALPAWARTRERLILVSTLLAAVAIAVLGIGLVGAYLTRTKLLLDASQPFPTPSNVCCAAYLYPWLPHIPLGLPGLENGSVNPNALGGTALLLLPLCAGVAAAGIRVDGRRRLIVGAGTLAAMAAGTVLVMSQSRTALLAAILTLGVFALHWRRGRPWLIALAAGAVLFAGAALYQARASSPITFQQGVERAKLNVDARLIIWRQAAARVAADPLLGIGINQFHSMPAPEGPRRVAHAHNTFLQIALDIGLIGLGAYLWLIGWLLLVAYRTAGAGDAGGALAAGAGLSLVGLHLFGIGDAITLGAKVGVFQWIAAGFILAGAVLAGTAGLGEPTGPPHA